MVIKNAKDKGAIVCICSGRQQDFVKDFENRGWKLIDSQVYTDNIARFGGKNISRQAFLKLESKYLKDERICFMQD